jgi:propionyl-CoA carboxylase alpha chain
LGVVVGEQVNLEIAGVQRTFDVHCQEHTYYVDSPLGSSTLVEIPRFPLPEEQLTAGSLVAPLPGVVHEVRVTCGDSVVAGDVVLVIESMKVHHWISAPLAGRITEIRVEAGSHVQGGAVLAVIEESS